MDLLAALQAAPARGKSKCKLQSILDDIPDDQPGKDELLARVADAKNFPAQSLTLTFTAIDRPVSKDAISDHRAARCRCYR